ncbi:MAG: ABC transporter ATP-binding protein [Elusimicrobia bacterium]|nr:ABC transporter ATP-binding protein [Elusimicrobiota bacterium]
MKNPIIEFKNFSWKYENAQDFSLKNINLKIFEGDIIGVVGANEQGKTTLLRCLNGLIPFNWRGTLKGGVRIFGKDILQGSIEEFSKKVGFVFSDPDSQFTSTSVEEEILFGLENLNLPIDEIKTRLKWAIEEFELEGFLSKPPYELSGGQRQRVAIASVVVMKPYVLVLDEPTSMLDPDGKSEIFEILKKLAGEENLTLIIAEHNLTELLKIAERIIHIDKNEIVYDGDVQRFVDEFDYENLQIYMPEVSQVFWHLKKQKNIPFLLEDAVGKFQK